MKVGVLLSGGLDSSVAAALLLEAGHEVTGLTMVNWSPDVAARAAQAASRLGISHQVVDLRSQFEIRVIQPFCASYQSGLTPNPCIACNEYIKFGLLLEEAMRQGCDRIATGHYARIIRDEDGLYHLLKGRDIRKDQSYFLYRLNQSQLSRAIFPLGEMTKQQVRNQASRFNLAYLTKISESQEVCFIENHYGDFLDERIKLIPGPIVDLSGKALGMHRGLPLYTIGQRKGLGIAAGRPVYVVRLDSENNTVYLGEEADLLADGLEAENIVWDGPGPECPCPVTAKIRYSAKTAAAIIESGDEGLFRVRFEQAQRAITPGQSVVFYAQDTVLGGGVIRRAFRC